MKGGRKTVRTCHDVPCYKWVSKTPRIHRNVPLVVAFPIRERKASRNFHDVPLVAPFEKGGRASRGGICLCVQQNHHFKGRRKSALTFRDVPLVAPFEKGGRASRGGICLCVQQNHHFEGRRKT